MEEIEEENLGDEMTEIGRLDAEGGTITKAPRRAGASLADVAFDSEGKLQIGVPRITVSEDLRNAGSEKELTRFGASRVLLTRPVKREDVPNFLKELEAKGFEQASTEEVGLAFEAEVAKLFAFGRKPEPGSILEHNSMRVWVKQEDWMSDKSKISIGDYGGTSHRTERVL